MREISVSGNVLSRQGPEMSLSGVVYFVQKHIHLEFSGVSYLCGGGGVTSVCGDGGGGDVGVSSVCGGGGGGCCCCCCCCCYCLFILKCPWARVCIPSSNIYRSSSLAERFFFVKINSVDCSKQIDTVHM